MSQEIEIEFKQLLTQSQYNTLLHEYDTIRSPLFNQVNHYFDTNDYHLKDQNSALRIRYKKGSYTLTLKQQRSDEKGILETHQKLTGSQWYALKAGGRLPAGEVHDQLTTLLKEPLPTFNYLGFLQTERTEIQLNEGLLVLDKSNYFDMTDYEMEFECTDFHAGKTFFTRLLDEKGMDWNKPANKIERFYRAKKHIDA